MHATLTLSNGNTFTVEVLEAVGDKYPLATPVNDQAATSALNAAKALKAPLSLTLRVIA